MANRVQIIRVGLSDYFLFLRLSGLLFDQRKRHIGYEIPSYEWLVDLFLSKARGEE